MKTSPIQVNEITVLQSEQGDIYGVKQILHKIMLFAVVLTLNLSSLFCFATFSDLQINYYVAAGVIIVASAVFFMLFSTRIKWYKILVPSVAAICAGGGIFFGKTLNGAKVVYDDVYAAIAKSMNWSSPVQIGNHTSLADGSFLIDADVFMILASVLICLILTFFAIRAVSFIFTFLFSFPLFEIGAAFGCVPNHIAFAGLISAWIAMIILSVSVRSKSVVKSKENGKRVTKRTKFKAALPEKCATGAFAAAVAVFILFESLSAAFTAAGYGRDVSLNELRHQIKSTSSSIFDYITGEDHDGSLKEGRLYKMGDLKIKKRHYITMKTQADSTMYLRGFVGGEYDGREWTAAEYTDNDAVKKLNKANYYTANLAGIMLYYSNNSLAYPSYDITLSNFRRKKDYAYQTYGTYGSYDLGYKNEAQLKPKNSGEYSFTTYDSVIGRYDVGKSAMLNEVTVANAVKNYNVFARAKYTKVPSNVSSTVKTVGESAKKQKTVEKKIDYIRNFLSKNCEYSLFSRKLPKDTDFADYFLNVQKSGYSAHFATAAALMLREAGVSARYVEGYLIPQGVNTSGEVDITDEYAHAWAEVYYDNYGWIPVEVTPTFYEGNFNDNINKPKTEKEDKADEPKDENKDDKKEEKNDTENIQPIPQIDDTLPANPEGVIAPEEKSEALSAELILIMIAATILAVIIVFAIRYIVLRQRLINGLENGTVEERMLFLYSYYERLLKFEGIKTENAASYAESAQMIAQNSKYIDNESAAILNELFIKAGFSDAAVGDDDAALAKEKVLEFAEKIYEREREDSTVKRILKRVKIKFFFVLKK